MTPQANKLLDDCFAHDRKRLRHAEALAILKERVRPVVGVERVALGDAAGRILATAAVAPRPVPAHTNAAVDGYSFAATDYDAAAGAHLAVEGRAAAGHPLDAKPGPRTAARIFTGAVLPAGHDTVVMQEDVRTSDGSGKPMVAIPPGLKRGANVRKAGEDVKEGESVLAPVRCCGRRTCPRSRRWASARSTASSASRSPSSRPATRWCARERRYSRARCTTPTRRCSRPLIAGAGAAATDLGVFPDDLQAVKQRLGEAARGFDVIITSGGASRGEEDHVVAALDALGKRHLWQLAIKPGRPMSFGQIGDCVVLGLPGNPVAVFVCFLLYVWPLLRRMGGAEWPEPRRYQLPALFAFPDRKVGRREFWRGMLRETPAGLAVDKFARDGSGLISGLRAADGLIDIPEDVPEVKPGDLVAFIPFTEFGIVGR